MQVTTDRLDEIAGDDIELKKTLLDMFVESYDKCLNDMRKACSLPEGAEADNLWHAGVHELKGSAYNLGFEELGDKCSTFETVKGEHKAKVHFIDEIAAIKLEVLEFIKKMIN